MKSLTLDEAAAAGGSCPAWDDMTGANVVITIVAGVWIIDDSCRLRAASSLAAKKIGHFLPIGPG